MLKANADGTLAQACTANMQSSLGLPDGYTMLHAAYHAGNTKVVEYLLSPAATVITRWAMDHPPGTTLVLVAPGQGGRAGQDSTGAETAAPVRGFQDERWRINMEDRVLVEYDALAGFGVFGVFNSHGDGSHALDYMARNLWCKLMSRPEWALVYRVQDPNLLASSIPSTCHDLGKGLRRDASRPTRDSRTMAIIALVCDHHLIVANVGDSCCILVRKKEERLGGGERRWCRGGGVH